MSHVILKAFRSRSFNQIHSASDLTLPWRCSWRCFQCAAPNGDMTSFDQPADTERGRTTSDGRARVPMGRIGTILCRAITLLLLSPDSLLVDDCVAQSTDSSRAFDLCKMCRVIMMAECEHVGTSCAFDDACWNSRLTSKTSPSLRNVIGLSKVPTPAGVPVRIILPLSSVVPCERNEMILATEKTRLEVGAD